MYDYVKTIIEKNGQQAFGLIVLLVVWFAIGRPMVDALPLQVQAASDLRKATEETKDIAQMLTHALRTVRPTSTSEVLR